MKSNTTDKKGLFSSEHYGKWVALSADKSMILDYSENFNTLFKKLGNKDVVYTKALDPSINYAF